MEIDVKETHEGLKNLNIWRTGLTYSLHKGPLYRKEWTNILFSLLPQPPKEMNIHYYDIRKTLPFNDNTFDNIYAMHVIEHLHPQEGLIFMQEIKRVLKPQGICRISTPDLEDVIRNYLKRLKLCREDDSQKNNTNHHWALLEVFDQLSRHKSGGEMVDTIQEGNFDEEYLKERYGDVYAEFNVGKANQIQEEIKAQLKAEAGNCDAKRTLLTKIKDKIEHKLYHQKLMKLNRQFNNDPRKTLESNKWMYDQFSLRLLMEDAGFNDYQVKDYKTSDIQTVLLPFSDGRLFPALKDLWPVTR